MGRAPGAHDRMVAVITANAASLLRIARLHSLCPDDAQDAYQRALLIYLERADRVEEATAGAWLRTVCKHEALKIREQRRRVLPPHDMAWDAQPSADGGDLADRAVSLERVARAAEALQACKPDEATAMLLKADGSSYAEIGELTGWTRTKVNRSLAEGRARFLRRFAAIDSGEACAQWAGVLSAIVDGEASPEDVARVRPHLRHCAACRATLRALAESRPALGALVPAGALVAAGGPVAAGGVLGALVAGLADRLARTQMAFEAVTTTKAAAVVASTAAIAAGGTAAAEHRREPRPQPPRAREAHVQPAARGRPAAAAAAARPVPAASRVAARASSAGRGTAPRRGAAAARREFARATSVAPARAGRPPGELSFEAAVRRPAVTHRIQVGATRAGAGGREFGFEG